MESELEKRIVGLVKKVGTHAKSQAFAIGETAFKSLDDPVTNVDRECEQMFEDGLGTGFNYWGEEFGYIDNGETQTVYIDPIDGTKSYTRGEFHTAFIATVMDEAGNQLVSVVYDFMKDITYVANEDESKLLTPVETEITLPRYIPEYSVKRILSTEPETLGDLPDGYEVYQQTGSVALSMAHVATGAYVGFHAPPYRKDGTHDIGDILAGAHILEMAGYVISDVAGKPLDKTKMEAGFVALAPKALDLTSLYTH